METTPNRFLHWTPRILSILFILFISLFSLDVFGEGYAWYELLVALFMHLVPTFILLIALAVAWRWPGFGGVLFLGLSIGFVFAFNLHRDWISALLIAGPPLLAGALFLLEWQSLRKSLNAV